MRITPILHELIIYLILYVQALFYDEGHQNNLSMSEHRGRRKMVRGGIAMIQEYNYVYIIYEKFLSKRD